MSTAIVDAPRAGAFSGPSPLQTQPPPSPWVTPVSRATSTTPFTLSTTTP